MQRNELKLHKKYSNRFILNKFNKLIFTQFLALTNANEFFDKSVDGNLLQNKMNKHVYK